MGGFLGRLLGSPKALTDTINAVSNGLDSLVYTKQEKAEDQAKAITEGRQMVIDWMKTTQGQNLSRRIIALSITFVWLFMFLARMVLPIIGIWAGGQQWDQSADVIGESIEQMTGAVMLILGFYFASPYLSGITKTAMNKFSKKPST